MSATQDLVFGPVPSRRLGRSLGINNIPPKTCSYSCVYCQLGAARHVQVLRATFHAPERIAAMVDQRVAQVREQGEGIDYLSFVPDGEPTLDVALGRHIGLLRPLGIPIAVISNASLMAREDVRADLSPADWVSLKVDSVRERAWRRLCRPHRSLSLDAITAGMLSFASSFGGTLVTETMLVDGVNTSDEQLQEVAAFVGQLRPAVCYISIPTRPPAEAWVTAPGPEVVERARKHFSACVETVETLTEYEGDDFTTAPDLESGLLAILAVHPMREQTVRDYLARGGANWDLVLGLIARGEVCRRSYGGSHYLARVLGRRTTD